MNKRETAPEIPVQEQQVIKLFGSNKKLLQQCGDLTVKANEEADRGNYKLFIEIASKKSKKLCIIAKRLNIDTSKLFLAPTTTWDELVLIPK